ncbi:hypothetical protein DFH09DRAFT_1101354 [Mycena vulgaris]|nr:hypothetical protein DFH09DRAFT_1101354 [Mycena vulgaris]
MAVIPDGLPIRRFEGFPRLGGFPLKAGFLNRIIPLHSLLQKHVLQIGVARDGNSGPAAADDYEEPELGPGGKKRKPKAPRGGPVKKQKVQKAGGKPKAAPKTKKVESSATIARKAAVKRKRATGTGAGAKNAKK